LTFKTPDEDSSLSEMMPVDVMPASNGEFIPPPPTAEQFRIMEMQDTAAEDLRRRMGLTRRTFVRSAAAYGLGLWAISQVMPGTWGTYASANPPGTGACDLEWPGAQLANLPGEFIFDVQSHHIDPEGMWRVNNPGFHAVFMALWEQSGPLGGFPGQYDDGKVHGFGRGGELDPIQNLSRLHYMKELYLDSSTNMTVLSAVPSSPEQQPLPIIEAAHTIDVVNKLAKSQRAVMHAFVMPNRGSGGSSTKGVRPLFQQDEFDLMEHNVVSLGSRLRGWKVYTPWGDVPNSSGWFLDDEIGMAFIDQVRRLARTKSGPNVIACHKGFALPAFDQRAASPRDIGPAARQNPDINFIVYHSGYDSEPQAAYPGDDKVNSADRGVNSLVKTLRENGWDASRFVPFGLEHGNVPNVYAEIGATMRSVMSSPDELAHLLGKLITHVGPRRVVWGTDSLWFGSPQSVIVALRGFKMSGRACQLYNLPYGLDGDRFDPRVNALDAHSYRSRHRHVPGWPTDGRAHPERTIRNGIFGRNAAVPYKVDPDAARHKISCDAVEATRASLLLKPGSELEVSPAASNRILGPRNRRETMALTWPNAPWAP
jgi:uncharacterized protein